jgi:hypothetical protein
MHRSLAACVTAAALLAVAAAPRVRADESHDEVGVPGPEQPSAESTAPPAEPATVPDAATAPPADGIPSYVRTETPVEAVHKPTGMWAPVAIATDMLVLRPFGFASLAAGAGAFIAISPFVAATRTVGDRVDTLKDRAKDVFTRPPGAY